MPDKRNELIGAEPAELVRAIAARRDRAAFAALFDLYGGRLKAWLMRSGSSAEAAEDLAQETLLTVWRKADLYDPGRASVSAWIFTIARNARIDRARRDNRSRQHLHFDLVEPEEPDRPDALLDSAEREVRVRAALDDCPRTRSGLCGFLSSRGDLTATLPRRSTSRSAR